MPNRRDVQGVLLLVLLLGGDGCAHRQLQCTTIKAGSTQTTLNYQQILENLAVFVCNREAVPWHIKLDGGIMQVTDQGSLESGPALNGALFTWLPTVFGERTVVSQWQVDPTIDPSDLDLLRLAYLKATDPLDADGSIRRAIYQQIAELSATKGILLQAPVVDAIIEQKLRAAGDNRKKREELEETRTTMQRLYREMDEWGERSDGQKEHDHRLAQIQRRMSELADLPFRPTGGHTQRTGSHELDEAQEKILALVELVGEDADEPNPFSQPWLAWGCKKDVPKGACIVGHCKTSYVWVPPESATAFRKFTLIVLALAPLSTPQPPSSLVAFSPGF
jgi:hypothetical protein